MNRTLIALAGSACCVLAAPDLSVFGELEDPQADTGDRVTVDFTVFNSGDEEANDPVVGYYFSDDAMPSDDDFFLEKDEVSDIDSGEGESENEQLTVPSVPDGEYFVLVVADPFGAIAEENENNNVGAFAITVGDPDPVECTVDLNDDGVLDLEDVQAYVNAFLMNDLAADLNDDGILDLMDVQNFVQAFATGCP